MDQQSPQSLGEVFKKASLDVKVFIILLAAYFVTAASCNYIIERNIIRNSPIVYVTRTGQRYHNDYHYSDRNRALSLYEANDDGYTACKVCSPPEYTETESPPFIVNYFFMCSLVSGFAFFNLRKVFLKK